MLLDVLIEHHEKIKRLQSSLAESLEQNKFSERSMRDLVKHVHQHIYFEETSLYPAVRNDANSSRINGLEVEHAGIWQLLGKINSYVENGDVTRAADRAQGLGRVLDMHYTKELEVLRIEIDSLTTQRTNSLVADVTGDTIPDGWICNVLRRYRR